MPLPPNAVAEDGPAREAGYDPRWYLWNNQRDHYYTHEGEAGWVRLLLWGGEALPAARDDTEIELKGGYVAPTMPRPVTGDRYQVFDPSGYLTNLNEFRRRMWRVWMEPGERLKIRLGGRPTKSPGPPSGWGSAGTFDDWQNGLCVHGGYPDGGDAEPQPSMTVSHGRCYYDNGDTYQRNASGEWVLPTHPEWPTAYWPGGQTQNLTNPDWTRDLEWHASGGAGASRVWLRPAGANEDQDRLMIVEPGQGGTPLFSHYVPRVPTGVGTSTRWAGHSGLSFYTFGQMSYASPSYPYAANYYDEAIGGNRWQFGWTFPDAPDGWPPLRWANYFFAWDGDNYDEFNEGSYMTNGSAEVYHGSVRSWPPPEFSDVVPEGAPLPAPPSASEDPRVPLPPEDDSVLSDLYRPLTSPVPSGASDHRTGAAGGTSKGGIGRRSAFGPRHGGGGGWGGGAAGNCDEWAVYHSTTTTTGTPRYLAGFRRFVRWVQRPARPGGRWWNEDRVEHIEDADIEDAHPSWQPPPGPPDYDYPEDVVWPLHRDTTGIEAPYERYGPWPYEDEPWKFGFGACWLCPEKPGGEGEAAWSVGHLAAGALAGITMDLSAIGQ